MSRFDAVRARWESSHPHRSEDSPTIPLLGPNMNSPSPNLLLTNHTLPAPGRRLTTSFGMLNKPLNTIRNKAFSRASRHASSETSSNGGHTRQSGSVKSLSQSMKRGKGSRKMVRSQTTSFLPVPTKSSFRTAPARPPCQPRNTVALIPQVCIRTPPRLTRPSYLPRSTTHPNLSTTIGRRASEFSRRTSSRWPLLEDARPLLCTPLLESPLLTPTSEEEWPRNKPNMMLEHPRHVFGLASPTNPNKFWDVADIPKRFPAISGGKENICTPTLPKRESSSPPLRSPRIIQHHKLLQPIQPLTPPNNVLPSTFGDSSPSSLLTTFLNNKPLISPLGPVFTNRKDLQRPAPLNFSPIPSPSAYLVTTAQPNAYWTGRFLSLSDKLLNESFDVSYRPVNQEDVDSSSGSTVSLLKITQPNDKQSPEFKRAEKVFQSLDEACTTVEAKRSLRVFRNMYAIKMKMPELKCEIPPTPKVEDHVNTKTLSSSIGSSGLSTGARKFSFMERLRGRKSSGKSVLTLRD